MLPCDEVVDSFTEDIMFDIPNDAPCAVSLPITSLTYCHGCTDFPPSLWAHMRPNICYYSSGAESNRGHLNAEFNAPHPNIYVFVEVLLRQQTGI